MTRYLTPPQDETRLHLMTRVAWMYFIEGLKQEEVANALGLSRIKVNRLLAAAREEGVVNIDIRGIGGFREDMTQRLRETFALDEVHIVPRAASQEAAVAAVGFALGSYLNDKLSDGMTVGIASGRSAHAVVNGLRPQACPSLNVVGLKGCLSNEGMIVPHETVARLAFVLNANAYQLAAPSYARNAEEYRLFTGLPIIARVLERAKNADIALLTASRVVEDGGLVGYGFITADEVRSLRAAGAVAGVLGVLIDADGQAVDHPLNRRQIGLDLDDLRRIPNVILSCAGTGKEVPLRAALRAGLSKVLFTDEETAERVLSLG